MVTLRRKPARGVILIDAIIGTILLGIALTAILGLAGRALSSQLTGESLQTAAMLLDEQLNLVLARGPDNYASRFQAEGFCDEPFQHYRYKLEFSGGSGGTAYTVTASVYWMAAGRERSESVQTMIAPRLGEEPDPDRRPAESVQREF